MSQTPYQRLGKLGQILVAARASQIDTFNLEDGSYLSSWRCAAPTGKETSWTGLDPQLSPKLREQKSDSVEVIGEAAPAAKRRKLSSGDSEEIEPTIQEEGAKSQIGTGKKKTPKRVLGRDEANIVLLASTADGQHLVAVTGEDKTIRVFKLSHVGVLEQLSERTMPKRPCALSISADNSTIMVGDKFGDVYSLPLIPALTKKQPEDLSKDEIPVETSLKEVIPREPAANHLTVHSKRNLKALENQKKLGRKVVEKTEPLFEHNLLLGHVSMLTDLCLLTIEGRKYIITADRDEHIRISRGIPQSHIIEGYCFGHTEFVSRICAPATSNTASLLISGGGGDELFAWDLPSGTMIQKTNLKIHVEKVMSEIESRGEPDEAGKIVVSGIYHVSYNDTDGQSFAVTCEGVPAIFFYFWNAEEKTLSHTQTLRLDGNPLDLMSCNWHCSLIVSIDTCFKSGSTTQARDLPGSEVLPLQYFMVTASNVWYRRDNQYLDTRRAAQNSGNDEPIQEKALANLLYNLGNLRKHEQEKEDAEE